MKRSSKRSARASAPSRRGMSTTRARGKSSKPSASAPTLFQPPTHPPTLFHCVPYHQSSAPASCRCAIESASCAAADSPRSPLPSRHRAYPNAEAIFKGDTLPDGCGPFVLNTGLSPDADEFAFREEPFATVLTEVVLKEEGVPVRGGLTLCCGERRWTSHAMTLLVACSSAPPLAALGRGPHLSSTFARIHSFSQSVEPADAGRRISSPGQLTSATRSSGARSQLRWSSTRGRRKRTRSLWKSAGRSDTATNQPRNPLTEQQQPPIIF